MPSAPTSKRMLKFNLFLIVLAALASLGTLKPDYSTGSTEETEKWSGERQAFTLTIAEAEAHVAGFDPTISHGLDFALFDLPKSNVNTAIWTLNIEGNEDFSMSGDFLFEEEGTWTDEGVLLGVLSRDLGAFCLPDSDPEEDCIPCSLLEGCTLLIEVDRCQPVNEQEIYFSIGVAPEIGEYKVRCENGEDKGPCDTLNGWLTLVAFPLEANLCGEGDE